MSCRKLYVRDMGKGKVSILAGKTVSALRPSILSQLVIYHFPALHTEIPSASSRAFLNER